MLSSAQGKRPRKGLPAVVVGAAMLLLPAIASADMETFTVNGNGDAADSTADGVCDSDGVAGAPLACTLRAALQESNDSDPGAERDTIDFDQGFNGEVANDTIGIATDLPAIADQLHIDGNTAPNQNNGCLPANRPCVGINATAGGVFPLVVAVSDVTIENVSVTNGAIGVDVVAGGPVTGFDLFGSWIGLKLDQSAGGNATGVFLDPNVTGADIGDATAVHRNVIANSSNTGLRLVGGDVNAIAGNYFGVAANGATQAANGRNIAIAGLAAGPNQATDNQIGGGLSQSEDASLLCDGACNVISGAAPGEGINLAGPLAGEIAAEDTTVRNNHIGLDALGTVAVPNAGAGVELGAGDDAFVAGNAIAGGTAGISSAAGGADDAEIDRNTIGLDSIGTSQIAPPTDGISLGDTSLSGDVNFPDITNNIVMATNRAMYLNRAGGGISGNRIALGPNDEDFTGPAVGMSLRGSGGVVFENRIGNTTSAAVRVENDSSATLFENVIGPTAQTGVPGDGVLIADGSGFVTIGDSDPLNANTISNVAGTPIVVEALADDDHRVGINNGSGNGELFLDLGDDGFGNQPTGPNNGIQAPAVGRAQRGKDRIKGTGVPDHTVRVYRSAGLTGASPTGLLKFLGEVTVGPGGGWKLNPAGRLKTKWRVSANQTSNSGDGSSEFAAAKRVRR